MPHSAKKNNLVYRIPQRVSTRLYINSGGKLHYMAVKRIPDQMMELGFLGKIDPESMNRPAYTYHTTLGYLCLSCLVIIFVLIWLR